MQKIKIGYILFGALILVLTILQFSTKEKSTSTQEEVGLKPNEWLYRQRAYPSGQIDHEAYRAAIKFRQEKQNQSGNINQEKNDNPWELNGPTNIGGRITDVEMTSTAPQIIYAGAASGGIFKSIDDGDNWEPIFDDAPNLSIGDLALAPSNENIIYVGTGEANAGGGSLAYDGTGVFKSINGGTSWTAAGLEDVGSIGKVMVHPTDPNTCYVGAMGHLFENNINRGVFKTTDGGESWEKALFVNDSTGVIDLLIHPSNPDIIYAATWERIRRVNRRSYGGPSSGIYRSIDGGDHWEKLTTGLPSTAGRIGIAISASNPDILYTIIAHPTTGHVEGVYKTTTGGNNWFSINSEGIQSVPYMWWFGKIYVDPTDPNLVYVAGFGNHKSTDGGNNWSLIFSNAHVDQHAICINPLNNNMLISGNDGGLMLSHDKGETSSPLSGFSIFQFYTCEKDYSNPSRLYGGAQDNGTIRTLTGQSDDWEDIYFGDGFKCLVDPSNSDIIYAEYQYGNLAKSTNGGSSFSPATNGINGGDRFNWNTAVIIDPTDPSTLYYGTNRLYKSEDKAGNWDVISPDLTQNLPQSNLTYGTITSISVSPIDNEIIWVGTDDGQIQVTTNGGGTWSLVSEGLPNRWITSIFADQHNENSAYVTYSGYRNGSTIGHIFTTDDSGENWVDITGDLVDIPVNELLTSAADEIIIATDIGVYYSTDFGEHWEILGLDLPNVVVTDISYHSPTNMLLAATYGRGMYQLRLGPGVPTNEVTEPLDLSAYPNPFSKQVTLSFNSPINEQFFVAIINVSGQLVHQEEARFSTGKNEVILELAELQSGVYFCQIKSHDGIIQAKSRLIKR